MSTLRAKCLGPEHPGNVEGYVAVPWQSAEGSHEEVAPLAEGTDHGRHGLAAAVPQGECSQRRVLCYAARACIMCTFMSS